MLTTTTDELNATHRPRMAAGIEREAQHQEDAPADERRHQHLGRGDPEQGALLAAQRPQVDLDADLEEEQDDTDVGQQMELLRIGDIARRER